MKTFLLLLITGISLVSISCGKLEAPYGATGKTKILTTGRWKLISSSAVVQYPSPTGPQTVDLFAILASCKQDDFNLYNLNNKTITDEGLTKCTTSDPQQYPSGTWSLSSNDSLFTFTNKGIPITAAILGLDSFQMTLQYVTNINSLEATTTEIYTHY